MNTYQAFGLLLAAATSVAAQSSSSSSSSSSTSSSSAHHKAHSTKNHKSHATHTSMPTHVSHSSGLSGGAIAGIVVGVVVGVALLCAIGFFFCCRSMLSKGKEKGWPDNTTDKEKGNGQRTALEQGPDPHTKYSDTAAYHNRAADDHTMTKRSAPVSNGNTGTSYHPSNNLGTSNGNATSYAPGQGSGGMLHNASQTVQHMGGSGATNGTTYGVVNP